MWSKSVVCLLLFAVTALAQDLTTTVRQLKTAGLNEYGLGHFSEAEKLLNHAMALAAQTGDTYLMALIHNSLGEVHQDEFEFDKAEHELKRAADLLRAQPQHID